MAADPTIRSARSGDGTRIRKLIHSILIEHGFSPDPTGLDADIEDVLSSYLDPGGAFDLLEASDGVLLGTVGIMACAGGVCELRKMYLKPGSRGRGLGRLLLTHALQRARQLGFARMVLQTDAAFDRALVLYRRFGFEPTGESPAGSPCDRILALDL